MCQKTALVWETPWAACLLPLSDLARLDTSGNAESSWLQPKGRPEAGEVAGEWVSEMRPE